VPVVPLIPFVRRLVAGLVAAVAVLAAAVPALAVGAGGVELQPQLPRDGDRSHLLAVEQVAGDAAPTVRLRNLLDVPRDVRVYAATAAIRPEGGVDVGGPGSLGWLPLDDRLQLAPGEVRDVALVMTPERPDLPRDGTDRHVALVLEVSDSDTLVTQAVTVVRLVAGRTPPVPALLLVTAVVLLVAAAAACARLGRRGVSAGGTRGAAVR
jgi:hypothetical protein